MIETMTPKIPKADPKISTMRIFTKSDGSCASAMAHELPAMPTQMPLPKFVRPTDTPDQKQEYPAKRARFRYAVTAAGLKLGSDNEFRGSCVLPEIMIARITP
jgi:hypothetical protein